jgi:predicted NBD/HSP70 family sugar kinase
MKKLLTKSLILRHLYFSGKLSSAELGERLDKSVPFVNKILAGLISENMIYEKGLAGSTGGRRPVNYAIVAELAYIVAVSVDQRYTRIAILDMNRKIVFPIAEFNLILKDNNSALQQLGANIAGVIEKSGIDKQKLLGIGIGMPGFIDFNKGINYTFYQGQSVTEYISDVTGLPVFIDNDSSVIALAELKFGAAVGKRNAMVINMAWGVGLGMVVNGELYRGENGFAGEFSHIPLFTNNKLCSCGKNGCLETEASLQVIVEKAIEGLQSGISTSLKGLTADNYEKSCEAVIDAAAKGDRFAVQLVSQVGYHIGRGVAILIHLFNPSTIILSGRGATAGKIWRAPIQQALNEYCIPRLADGTVLEISAIGAQAEIIGAAALVMEHFSTVAIKKQFFPETEENEFSPLGNE